MMPLPLLAQDIIMNLDKFRFEQAPGRLEGNALLFLILLVVLLALAPVLYFFLRYKARMEEAVVQREDTRFRFMLSEYNLKDKELAILQALSGSENPADTVPILDSRAAFEEAVEAFRENNPGHALLRQTPQLRQRFDFGFNNVRNPFVDSRMLAPGQKMRCRIRAGKREVEFVTTLLAVTEENFIIRPPVSKGRAVSLGHLPELVFRISRENDAEYQFTCRVKGELQNETHAVILEHTRTINRLLFRNAERVPVRVPVQFFVIGAELAASTAKIKISDAQNAIEAELRDLSLGGAMAYMDAAGEDLTEGQVLVFKLPQAQIKEELTAVVVGQTELGQDQWQIHMRLQGLKELNRLKINRYLETVREQNRAPQGKPATAAQ